VANEPTNDAGAWRLRDVELSDAETYVRMRCDPVMMAELGGPLPRDSIEAKVARDVASVRSGEAWIFMISRESRGHETVAGSVVLWSNSEHGEPLSEIGWMVLPEFQGRGLGKLATAMLLAKAHDAKRWGAIHAFPGGNNAASNGICRSLGFELVGQTDATFAGRTFRTNHWRLNPPKTD
jgi:RimJ/RimL family protein N-acetyltransferase